MVLNVIIFKGKVYYVEYLIRLEKGLEKGLIGKK